MQQITASEILLSGLLEVGVSIEDITSASINQLLRHELPSSRLMSYCLDTAADQYISEEFYQRYPELLTFLKDCGCRNDEVLFREYVETHKDIFKCKTYSCEGKIVGGCPKMYCEDCGRNYFLKIDKITDTMCHNCIANTMGECTEESRRKRHIIFAI
jgi:hypothetical protein